MWEKKNADRLSLIVICLVCLIATACDRYQNGIREGERVITKALFFNDDTAANRKPGNSIRTIQVGNFDSTSNKDLVIFNRVHCYFFDARTRKHKKTIEFRQPLGQRPELLKIKDDGSMEIMIQGGGFDDVGLVNTFGEYIWKYRRESGTSPRMTGGKFVGDAETEFYVADFDGVHKLDYSGKQIWKTEDNIGDRNIQLYKTSVDGPPLIVTRDSKGRIRYWNTDGKLLKEVIPKVDSYGLEIIHWPDDYRILAIGDYEIIIMDLDGRVVFRHRLKEDLLPFFIHLLEVMDIRGVPVKLDSHKHPYLAIIAKHRAALKKSTLSIFSPEGKLIYQEMLNSSMGIGTLDNPDGTESLLVGDGATNVWIYNLKKL